MSDRYDEEGSTSCSSESDSDSDCDAIPFGRMNADAHLRPGVKRVKPTPEEFTAMLLAAAEDQDEDGETSVKWVAPVGNARVKANGAGDSAGQPLLQDRNEAPQCAEEASETLSGRDDVRQLEENYHSINW
uniref:Uncharacterized protein n=1 Tax=Noctiluca scintillans TaxID=2966 RepID=A0A7S0ZXM0_NOCSC|eukprot:CAMPEP_0194537752 /NCGR_PEP_ID=MMETSP0253-20130528/77106_1 /TAXON_ID=2966 /ORGANISM="Noctiluca scintillans" /LENGTH=130 /DNA_ID=CAMNT_0039383799 /DNA_START=14 /DNA_END=406 /DNA_ORIENTATION=-